MQRGIRGLEALIEFSVASIFRGARWFAGLVVFRVGLSTSGHVAHISFTCEGNSTKSRGTCVPAKRGYFTAENIPCSASSRPKSAPFNRMASAWAASRGAMSFSILRSVSLVWAPVRLENVRWTRPRSWPERSSATTVVSKIAFSELVAME